MIEQIKRISTTVKEFIFNLNWLLEVLKNEKQ